MRIHAFEFTDLSLIPGFLRDSVVESLGNALRWSGIYKNAAGVFADFCASLQSRALLDLCSGSGEPIAILLDALNKQGEKLPRFLLSDLFPVIKDTAKIIEQFPENVQAVTTPVDALNVPDSYSHSARVIISAFHHFPPDLAKGILRDSAEKGKPIFILEPMTGNIKSSCKLGFFFFLATMINPFLSKQDCILKIIFSYIIPLIPLMVIWDSVISFMRMYSKEELFALTSAIDIGFKWEFQEIPVDWNGTITVFIGKPLEDIAVSGPADV